MRMYAATVHVLSGWRFAPSCVCVHACACDDNRKKNAKANYEARC